MVIEKRGLKKNKISLKKSFILGQQNEFGKEKRIFLKEPFFSIKGDNQRTKYLKEI